MRLLKLSISAFGPYAKEQIIDFEKINDKKLFLVTGPTGSGKTSIFDAISYALFGYSSGNERDGDSLISHFSNLQDETYVSLEFTIRENHYYVKRMPKQVRKKVKGDGTTLQVAQAELIINQNKVYHGVQEVKEKIQEILGINYNQFRQIVMLPQGEFRKLLEANSQEREDIFRKIFKTEGFKEVQERLKIKTNELRSMIKSTYQLLDNTVEKIHTCDEDELVSCIKTENKDYEKIILQTKKISSEKELELKELSQLIEKNDNLILKFEKEINEGKEINKKIIQKNELLGKKKTLIEKSHEIDVIKNKISKAKDAQVILKTELEIGKISNTIHNLDKLIEKSKKDKEIVKKDLINREDDFRKIKEEYNNVKLDNETLFQLKQQLEKFQEYNTLQKKLSTLDLEIKKQNTLILDKSKLVDQYQKQMNDYQNKLNLISNLTNQLGEIKLNRQTIENKRRQVNEIIKTLNDSIDIREKHQILVKEYQETKEKFQKERQMYDAKRELFLSSQAGILASNLVDSYPCPVCGSTKHPKKAVLVEKVLSEGELNGINDQVVILEKKVNEIYTRVYNLNQRKVELEKLLNELEEEKLNIDSLLEKLFFYQEEEKQIRNKWEQLNQQIDSIDEKISHKENYEKKLLEINELLTESEAKISYFNEIKDKINHDYQVKLSIVKKAEEEYIRKYPSEEEIIEEITKLENKINKVENDYLKLQEEVNEKKDKLLIIKTKIQNNEELITENKIILKEETDQFFSQLKQFSFISIDDYHAFLFSDDIIDNYTQKVKEYDEEMNYITKTLSFLEKELCGKIDVNIESLVEKQKQEKESNNKRKDEELKLHAILQNNRTVLTDLKILYKKVKDKLLEFNVLSDISKLANGDNALRLTFERFVLAAYFDEIIKAANLRLRDMTNNRYILCRKEEKGKGNAQQGLDLEVIDAYTGKMRTVKTLSGGEAFVASLALALGLADVVQSYSGGVELDTIFIDEGFGSLDPEALEHAIETLVNIQKKGRLVGIISHVEELKERIDAKLMIIPSKEGSIARFNI